MAITQSPTRSLSESPHLMAGIGRLLGGSTLSSATSMRLSEPISLALSWVSSRKMTVMSSAPWMTWLLVMM
jgi:hypothetical protein